MGLLGLRFSFDHEAPSLEEVERALRAEVGRSLTRVEPGPRLGGRPEQLHPTLRVWNAGHALLVQPFGDEWIVRSDLDGRSPIDVARRVLVSLGGTHPPRFDPDAAALDFGEGWYGVLAEADDLELRTRDRSIRIWQGFLPPLEALARADLLALLEAGDLDAFERVILAIPDDAMASAPWCDALPVVRTHLLAFLSRARESALEVEVCLDA